jgi:heptosyltransferase I
MRRTEAIMPHSGRLHPSVRILIVRLSAIGDVIHSMPIACAIRERYPSAFLAWMVEERGAKLLEGHEALDELIVLRRGWLKSPRMVWRLRRRLHAMRLDLAIEAQGLTKAAIGAWLSGAKRRIGFGGVWGRELSPWLNTELVNGDGLHAVERNLRLVTPLGIESPDVRFQIPHSMADDQAADTILCKAGMTGDLALITVGAGWPSKLWPAERFAAVADYLGRCRNLPSLVVWGNAEEEARARQVVDGSGGYARAAPKMTLRELAAVARRARLCIGSDTGPLHLAAAVGTPCVGLYGPWPADKHGPYGPQHVTVQKMCCEGSTRQRRNASPVFMEAIDVESVCEACDRIHLNTLRHAG